MQVRLARSHVRVRTTAMSCQQQVPFTARQTNTMRGHADAKPSHRIDHEANGMYLYIYHHNALVCSLLAFSRARQARAAAASMPGYNVECVSLFGPRDRGHRCLHRSSSSLSSPPKRVLTRAYCGGVTEERDGHVVGLVVLCLVPLPTSDSVAGSYPIWLALASPSETGSQHRPPRPGRTG